MKTKIPLQENVTVLAANNKQARQFDRSVSNPISNALGNALIRISSFFNKDAKFVTVDLAPTAGEKLDDQVPQDVRDEAAKENVKVISADGAHVGNVERVFAESTFGQITHLLISMVMPAKERKLIPIKWVQTMGEEAVHLHVTKDLVEELADASIIW